MTIVQLYCESGYIVTLTVITESRTGLNKRCNRLSLGRVAGSVSSCPVTGGGYVAPLSLVKKILTCISAYFVRQHKIGPTPYLENLPRLRYSLSQKVNFTFSETCASSALCTTKHYYM